VPRSRSPLVASLLCLRGNGRACVYAESPRQGFGRDAYPCLDTKAAVLLESVVATMRSTTGTSGWGGSRSWCSMARTTSL